MDMRTPWLLGTMLALAWFVPGAIARVPPAPPPAMTVTAPAIAADTCVLGLARNRFPALHLHAASATLARVVAGDRTLRLLCMPARH